MNRAPVKSSQIKSVGYDPDEMQMHVEFNGGDVYEYSNVTPNDHRRLTTASSVGQHFHQHVKNQPRFNARKLP